jgi:DNA primase|tara:strand:+ start:8925 stop:9860 length:936 start_codon:yes stop_codon:yes gene_type:complete
VKEKKLKILTNVLGSGYRTNNEYLFKCPYCEHHKRKFSVNLEKGYYKCWVCDTRGKNLYRVVRRFGTNHDKSQWRDFTSEIDFDQLEDLFAEKIEEKQILEMPEGFVSLANRDVPPTGFAARNYLRNRGISRQDIVWWKMGYCSGGEYEGRIIIPSFDEEGDLNYFISRSYDRSYYPKYKNPPASKNIIFNDLFVDWSSDIVLVEGIFDAIIAGRNAVPILGSTLNEHSLLLRRIIKEDAGVYIALDPDAKKKELEIIKTLLDFDIEVWKVDVGDNDDVGSMSKEQFQKCLENATLITPDNYLLLTLAMSV